MAATSEELEAALEKAQAKIAEQQMLFNEILEGTMAGFWDWNIPENTEYLSPSFKRMFGYDDDEMENAPSSWQSIIFREDLPRVFELFKAHVDSKGAVPYDSTLRYHHKDGSIVHVWCRGKVVEWAEDGSPVRMVGSHIDVTALTKAKQQFEEKAREQDLIIQGIDAGVWNWNILTGEEWWSDKFYTLIGYERGEITSTYDSFLYLLHPEDKPKVLESVKAHLEKRKPYKIEIRFKVKNGTYRWFESTGQAMWNEEGLAIYMSGSVMDIQQRKEHAQKLAKNEMLLKETSSLAKVGGWEVQLPDMTPVWADEVYHIHELPVGEQPVIEKALDFYPEPDRTEISDLLNKALTEGIGFDRELNFITAKNNPRIVRSIGSPMKNNKGDIVGLQGVFQDVTEKTEQKIALQESLDMLSEQNKRLLSFAHIVSHNLNSHTSNIKMLLSFLKSSLQNNNQSDIEESFQLMTDASNNLETTIYHLNEIVQIQTDINKKRQDIYFADAWRSLQVSIASLLHESGAEVHVNFEVPKINYVPAYLESIFLNLITNAIKYRKPAVKPQIQVHTYEEEGKVWLLVEDNGMGINMERHGDKIFGMYKTFHKNEDSRGIGLFITKTQVEAMGGAVEVESREDIGTTFKIRLN
jgi:PAS domain S-box-containing protein